MNLNGKTFRAVSNSENGSLNTETEMCFTSDDDIIIGEYSGGTITAGHVLARRIGEFELDMLYQGAKSDGQIQAGRARALFSTDDHGDMYMDLDWQWLTGDQSHGHSRWILLL